MELYCYFCHVDFIISFQILLSKSLSSKDQFYHSFDNASKCSFIQSLIFIVKKLSHPNYSYLFERISFFNKANFISFFLKQVIQDLRLNIVCKIPKWIKTVLHYESWEENQYWRNESFGNNFRLSFWFVLKHSFEKQICGCWKLGSNFWEFKDLNYSS